jgi:hypothetical protein
LNKTFHTILSRNGGDAHALLRTPLFVGFALLVAFAATIAPAQKKPSVPAPLAAPPALKRTTTRHELRRFGHGGMVTLYGAPDGSINIEGSPRAEVDVNADIELRADTEEDLSLLAVVNRFVLDDDANHIRIITTGTHDRTFMKRAARDFPKRLLTLPWKIDYRVRVPAASDLEIYAGRGPLKINGVEGALRLNAGDAEASFVLTGGDVEATIQRGTLNFRLAQRSWRGRGANFRLGTGTLTVELPPNFNGDIDAEVLRNGRVENTHAALAPRERTQTTERSLHARAGMGGTLLSFTLGDGTLRIKQTESQP